MLVDPYAVLVAIDRRCAETELDPGRGDAGRTRCQRAVRHRAAVGRQWLGIEFIFATGGELEHRTTCRERLGVNARVGDFGTGHLHVGTVARAAGTGDGVGLGLEGEGVAGDQRVGLALLQVEVQLQVDTAEGKGHATRRLGVEHPAIAGFGGVVVARSILDRKLGAADHGDGVRLVAAEPVVVVDVGRDLTVGQCHPHIGRRRGSHGGFGTAGVQRLLEGAPAAVVAGHGQHVADLELQLGLVALVAVGAIAVADEGLGIGLGAGEQVLAVFITGIHQAQQLLFELAQLGRGGLALGVGETGVACTQRELVDPLQDGVDGVQRGFSLAEAVLHRGGVGRVLLQHRVLVFELQQAGRADRIIGGSAHANQVAGFFAGFHHVGVVALIVGSTGFVILGSRNTHGLRLLKWR